MTETTRRRGSFTAPTALVAVAAAAATTGASTALTGVVAGWTWLGYIALAAAVVGGVGVGLRALRLPILVVGLGQLVGLSFLITALFAEHGVFRVIPGPAAFAEFNDLLVAAFEQIRTGLAPVTATPAMLCLLTIAIGLAAIVIDTLAVGAGAPAATGLALLCIYAVPASLAERMLPWWTFLLGAAAFAFLLTVNGNHRRFGWSPRRVAGNASAPVGLVAIALIVGLLAGETVTAVGTVGRLPGNAGGRDGVVATGLGVNPFTSLRGMLNQNNNAEMFRVYGLGQEKPLLRAFTLDTYQPNAGWGLAAGPMPAGVPADRPLPPAPGDDGTAAAREIRIEPVSWVDVWMPVYGSPRELRNVRPGWFYDSGSGAVFAERKQQIPAYTEVASMAEPSKDQLRTANSPDSAVSPVYLRTEGVDPRVVQLAKEITAGRTNDFDKATALWEFFTAGNRFTYDTETAAVADTDALADFLFNGRRGFCEQFASAMGVMLRAVGIPARVAVGFTGGISNGDYRTITTQDAHAWVEVFFGDRGWVSFDPTPRSDGRGYLPSYLDPEPTESTSPPVPESSQDPIPPPSPQLPEDQAAAIDGAQAPDPDSSEDSVPGWILWTGAALLVVAVVMSIPALLRVLGRRRRLRSIDNRSPQAVDAAWQEILHEYADRGWTTSAQDTVRTTAQQLASQHNLDEHGQQNLDTVVGIVERAWYSPQGRDEKSRASGDLATAFHELRRSLHRNAPVTWRERLLPKSLISRLAR